LFGQFDTATVLGTIRDASGLPVSGSKVELTNLRTGITQTTQTDGEGNYQFFNVRIGVYRVTAEANGFKKGVAEDFTVTVNARQRVDLQLQVGQVTESIVVSDAAALLETDSSSRSTVVSSQQIVNLPLNGRAYADLALLAPGVRRSGIADSRDASFNVNGMRSSQNNFVLDGVDNNAYGTSNQGFSNQVVQLTPDAVAEFRLETNNFSAEYGRAGGAIINATLKSGTNQFHGAVWEFLRNTKLNAEGFFHPQFGKPVLIQNQFGGAIGGPIVKEKLFFFADYEGFRRVTKELTFASLPRREWAENLNLGIPIRNPYTGDIYQDGRIPANAVSPAIRTILLELPAPNRQGTGALGAGNNFESLPRRSDQNDKGDIKIDYFANNRLNLFGRYSHRLLNNLEPANIPGPSGGNSNGNVRVLNWQVATGATWTITPSSVLEARLGISRTEGGKTPIGVGTPTIGDRFRIPNIPNDPSFTGGVPQMNVTGFSQIGIQGSNPQFQNPEVYNPKVNLSKILGRHTLKTGYEYQRILTEIDDFNPKYGAHTFAGRFSAVPGTPNDDRQFIADLLFGARSAYSLSTLSIFNYRQAMNFFYVQDDFKVSKNLTLNLGLRYEYGTPQWERDNRLSNYDEQSRTMIRAADGGIFERARVRPDRNNWGPRLGVAYTLNPKTVIRSAYGISYIHFNRMGGENILAFNLPHIVAPSINQTNPRNPCADLNQNPQTCFLAFDRGFPNNFLNPALVNQRQVRANHIPYDLKSRNIQTWHFTIQRELFAKFVLDVGYVGTRGRNLMILGDLNQARPNNIGETLNIDDRRPIQTFGFIQTAFDGGFLDYHALQTKLERRFANGFYFLNSFTWSKAIDNASGHLETQNGDNSRVNFRDLRSEKGLSGYDQPFNNTTTLIYDLPILKQQRNALGYIAGGWRVTAINFWTAGLPGNLSYNPTAAQSVSSAPTYRPDLLGDPRLANATDRRFYLDPTRVVVPTAVNRPFGNAGRNIVRGPSLFQLNLGLHKDFPVSESNKIELRAEAFNLTNKTNLATPVMNRSNANFGVINGLAGPARQLQLALRYAF
jgi:hypothetical protein